MLSMKAILSLITIIVLGFALPTAVQYDHHIAVIIGAIILIAILVAPNSDL